MSNTNYIIRKYENRKYYDYISSCYVNLDEILELNDKQPVQVLDCQNNDVTTSVLAQAVLTLLQRRVFLKALDSRSTLVVRRKLKDIQKALK